MHNINQIIANQAYKKAVELDRDDITYWQKYAKDLIRIGKRREGIELFRKRVEIAPEGDYGSFSAFLWNLHYFPESTTEMFCREYKRWGETYFPVSMAKTSHGNNPDPNRKYTNIDLREPHNHHDWDWKKSKIALIHQIRDKIYSALQSSGLKAD